ncbi:MAG: baseplate J/gp47 family protein [Chloroflexi bacterium]|nr:baseplate J/gp47 family protein [Chloroflexota bacterium]
MRQIIPLEPNDEIATIRAKIENAEFSQAVLVTPRDCSALMSDGGMSLVRRAADDAGIEIAIVTRAEEMRARAARFGLPTYNSIHQAQRDQWRMQSLARGFGATIAPAPELDPRALAPNVLTRVMQNRNALAFVGAAIFFLLLAACLLIPAARVRLVPSPIALTIATDALADPTISQINSAERWIPARKISREISGAAQLKTTTQKSVPDARASGSVIFTYLRNEDTVIPQGAIVKTSGGVPIRFSVTTTVTVPSGIGNRVEAPISALDPGPSGNVKELAINAIEGSLSFESRVINLKATTLGNVRNVRVVTMDDKKKLEAQLTAQLLQQGSATLTGVLKEGEFILPDTIVIDAYDTTFDRAVDEPADILNLKISGYAIGLAADRIAKI